jgi:hypothetical protein
MYIIDHWSLVRGNFGFYDDFLISGSKDEMIYIWDVKKKRNIACLGQTFFNIED